MEIGEKLWVYIFGIAVMDRLEEGRYGARKGPDSFFLFDSLLFEVTHLFVFGLFRLVLGCEEV